MRRLDWIALLLIIAVAVGGEILGGGESVPENRSPRRPDPELFVPKVWDAETRAWLQEGAQKKRPGKTDMSPFEKLAKKYRLGLL